LVKTLEELKEIARQSLVLQLEVMKEITSLNIKDATYFIKWFTNHPLGKDITKISRSLALPNNEYTTRE
jgi:hypothetical protein